ncbi:MAG: flagellar basal body-associated FliL family protein [Thiohalophilus sp.]|uniref:flagellar basal body-associated FliL family protein n=1 Tax=Thiohalophilus sp. TaxID=3028392 RepID=UPI0028708469|nr:flagellar basal body-associated FliL family protein [Thiohalophilus sp.]MDR9435843.1 flagellar basal body-associated FliL family protein [Thiohalophilus sp.]
MKPRALFALLVPLLMAPPLWAEDEEDKSETKEQAAPVVYTAMQPALVVNVNDNGRVRHMQVSVQLKLKNKNMEQYIQQYNPALRHELVMLLSDQPVKKLTSAQGKIALRDEALSALQNVMEEHIQVPAIEAVYFTEMVIQ